jgi:exopolysaccharide biosynthesis polyprenyl glycosylphosphotransferase
MSAPTEIRPDLQVVGEAPADRRESERRDWAPTGPQPVQRLTWWQIADALLAICVLAGVVITTNLDHMPQGLDEFLAIRLTIKNVLLITGFAWAWPFVLTLCGLYMPTRLRTGHGEWPRLILAGTVGCILASVFPLTSESGLVGPVHVLLFGAAVVPITRLLRVLVRVVSANRHPERRRHVLLVGSGKLAARLYRRLLADPLQDITVVGFVDSEPHAALAKTGPSHLGDIQDLEHILMRSVVDDVFIGLPIKSRYEQIQQIIAVCDRVGVSVSYSTDFFGGGSTSSHPVLSLSRAPNAEQLELKRAIDVVGAVVLLITFAPVMLAIVLAIKLTTPGPALFAHERYGYMKRRFQMYKFRTMVNGAEQLQPALEQYNEASGPAFKISNDPRITRVGRFLRRTSLDELPQLWHVLRGEMSLVGPRPLPTRDVRRVTEPWLMRRFSMRPGLTCLWQVSGRSTLSFQRWIELDLEYIDRWSLLLDSWILLRTIPAVIRGTGAM